MIGFVTTKKHISTVMLIIFLSVVLIVAVIWKAGSANVSDTNANQTAEGAVTDKIAFIESLGYTVDRSVSEESKEIKVPTTFSGMYEKYQQIQLEGGYDLTKYSGETVVVYAYKLIYDGRSDVYAHLIMLNGVVIGGDIAALSVSDGFIYPLISRKN